MERPGTFQNVGLVPRGSERRWPCAAGADWVHIIGLAAGFKSRIGGRFGKEPICWLRKKEGQRRIATGPALLVPTGAVRKPCPRGAGGLTKSGGKAPNPEATVPFLEADRGRHLSRSGQKCEICP